MKIFIRFMAPAIRLFHDVEPSLFVIRTCFSVPFFSLYISVYNITMYFCGNTRKIVHEISTVQTSLVSR